jgi:hypothetical protein
VAEGIAHREGEHFGWVVTELQRIEGCIRNVHVGARTADRQSAIRARNVHRAYDRLAVDLGNGQRIDPVAYRIPGIHNEIAGPNDKAFI